MNKITLQIVERRISMGWFSKFIKWVTPPTKVDEVVKAKVIKAAVEDATVELEPFKEAPVTKGKPKRARTKKGTYIADDKSTPDVNEAWEGGKAPKPKAKVTKIKK